MYTVIGAGLAGLSCSYHLGHDRTIVFESNRTLGGHARTYDVDGYRWDEGPHVSFTSNQYVKDLFEKSVGDNGFYEFPVTVTNYFDGVWIPHPAQSNLAAIPQPLRDKIFHDFINTRPDGSLKELPKNYSEWLCAGFGNVFAENFPAKYTRKYWAAEPTELDVDWVGNRLFLPDIENVKRGYLGIVQNTHYIQRVRYPCSGGFYGFLRSLQQGANVQLEHKVVEIDLDNKVISFSNGVRHSYRKLISTIPLLDFVRLANAPSDILSAAAELECTSLLLVNVTADHEPLRDFHWMYVYDEDFLSTRITSIGSLAKENVPIGKTGIQVEIYGRVGKPLPDKNEAIKRVSQELIDMGIVSSVESVHVQYISHANVLFDLKRRAAQEKIFSWLTQFGLVRTPDDLEPMTDWNSVSNFQSGDLMLAGRFGQWKYYWSDDCVLRGKQIAESQGCAVSDR